LLDRRLGRGQRFGGTAKVERQKAGSPKANQRMVAPGLEQSVR
jgi:hypothetical protein